MDMVGAACTDAVDELDALKSQLRAHRDLLLQDNELLSELGLRLDAANIVDFGPVALSRAEAAHKRESNQRRRLEAVSRANFAAQARTHASVIDLVGADSLTDLARRVDCVARLQFGLLTGALAVEAEEEAPDGWRTLAPGQVDLLIGRRKPGRMGVVPTAIGLFAELGPIVGSVSLVRLTLGASRRLGVVAFAALETDAFAPEMGSDLVTFLARVIEQTAERWPVP
ncbi:MAG TPA: DUF484 family protein [Caulobacteraceae bacterium]|jgi:hypothetical protein